MKNKTEGPAVPAPAMTQKETVMEIKLPKRPVSGYGPSLPLKNSDAH